MVKIEINTWTPEGTTERRMTIKFWPKGLLTRTVKALWRSVGYPTYGTFEFDDHGNLKRGDR